MTKPTQEVLLQTISKHLKILRRNSKLRLRTTSTKLNTKPMSNLIFDSYKETRLEEIEEELYQENPLDPHISKKAYEILCRELDL